MLTATKKWSHEASVGEGLIGNLHRLFGEFLHRSVWSSLCFEIRDLKAPVTYFTEASRFCVLGKKNLTSDTNSDRTIDFVVVVCLFCVVAVLQMRGNYLVKEICSRATMIW